MLSAYGAAVAAYTTEDGELICAGCARATLGELGVARLDSGLDEQSRGIRPLIRYELDQFNGERAWEYAAQDYEVGSEAFDKAVEDYPEETCDRCGDEL